jgi:WD40 repeat protein
LELQAKVINGFKFSEDGRYLVINKQPAMSAISGDVTVFEVQSHRMAGEIKGYNALFWAGDYLVGRKGNEQNPFWGNETTVYALGDGTFQARKIKDFSAYAALPDGKTLLGGNVPLRAPEISRNLLAYDMTGQITRSQATPPKPYALLPPLPKRQSPVFIPLRGFQYLDDHQTLLIYDEVPLPSKSYTARTTFQFWNIKQKKTLLRLESSRLKAFNMATTPGGLCACVNNGQIEIWNYHTAQRQALFHLPLPDWANIRDNPQTGRSGTFLLALSPDGTLLAGSRIPSGEIFLWDIKTKTLQRTLQGHRDAVLCLAFAPDGKTLASGSLGGSVKLWRIK